MTQATLTRNEELTYDTQTRSGTYQETILWNTTNPEVAVSVLPYLNNTTKSELDLDSLVSLAKNEGIPELENLLSEEFQRDGLEETIYHLTITE